jgi:hypothetical protein
VTKECRRCRKEKPSAEFPRNRQHRDGLSSWCLKCQVEATREYRRRRREGEKETQKMERIASNERLRIQSAERKAKWEKASGIRATRDKPYPAGGSGG